MYRPTSFGLTLRLPLPAVTEAGSALGMRRSDGAFRRAFRVSILISTLLASPSCERGADHDHAAVQRDSAGVAIVEHVAGDRPFDGQIVHIADLATPDDALSPLPWAVVAHRGAQRVFVADREGRRVAVFDAAGGFVGELGRGGEGPGEFLLPSALALEKCGTESCHGLPGPDEILVVLDSRRAVLSRWSSNGDFLGEQRAPTDYWGPGFAVGPGYLAFATSNTTGMRVEQQLEIQGGDENHTIHEVAYEMALMELPCATMPAPRIFAPQVVWAHEGGTLYYLNGPGYRIDAHTGGRLAASIRRPVAPIEVARAKAVMAVQLGLSPLGGLLRQCDISAEELVDGVGHEEKLAPVLGLAVDPAGRLWVARTVTGLAPEAIDVFGAEGEYLGTLSADVLPVAFLSGSRFVGVRLEPSTGQVLASVYDVRRDAVAVSGGERVVTDRRVSRAQAAEDPAENLAEDPAPRRVAVPNPAGLREFRDCAACPLMIELPPGRYLMGRTEGEEKRTGLDLDPNRPQRTRDIERPQIAIEIGHTFALGKYEVTFDEWDQCVEAGGCNYRPTDRGWGRGNRPVIHVSRLDAEEYLAWLTEVTGQAYRLPSNAEWEYAARAGTTTARWWGDELGRARAVCDGCGSRWDDLSSAPVGSFPPNPWGLHDMLSNVSEVVADCWHESYDGHPTDGSPRLEAPPGWPSGECKRATWRGGGWPYFSWTVRAAHRSGGNMPFEYRGDDPRAGGSHGFRVARTVESPAGSR
ncbi:MAG: SUMF1/EgtB/PvdO family nonheme iron enzyme [Gemmatimonadota bacterium]|nr:SUMF1/EgtB/PvdO family nonheme iron enzyme [Gemmatimonadota bacterium]